MAAPQVTPQVSLLLPARSGTPVPSTLGVIQGSDEGWYMLEAWSGNAPLDPRGFTGGPWALTVQASGQGGVAQNVYFNVPGSARRCVYGRAFTLTAFNLVLSPLQVTVRGSAVDSPIPNQNMLEFDQLLAGAGSSFDVVPPPYSHHFRFDVPQAERAAVYVELLLPTGAACGQYAWGEQPDVGIAIAGIQTIRVHNGSAAASSRIVFSLE